MSQPNLSRALRLLREEFNDPLFVRRPRGLAPTSKARELAPLIRETLSRVQTIYSAKAFDPKTAVGRFTIVTSDYIEFLLMTKFVERVNREAPGITLNFRPFIGYVPKEGLEKGECELCIIVLREPISSGLIRQDLFRDPFLSVVRKKHPILGKKITIDRFCEYGHLLISPQGTLWASIDEKLAALKKKRRLVVGTPSAVTAAISVSETDLVLTASLRLIEGMKRLLSLETFKTPFEIEPIRIVQVWHERSQEDPLHRWIRTMIKELL